MKKQKSSFYQDAFHFTVATLIVILSLNVVSAVNVCGNENSFLGTFKQGTNITLKQSCDSCSFVNLSSVTYPSSEQVNYNTAMDKNGIEYTAFFGDTNTLGCYSYNTLGDKDGVNTAESIDFNITVDGHTIQTFPYQFFVMVLGLILIIVSYTNDRLSLFRYMGSMIMMVMGVITLYPGFGYINWDTLIGKVLGFGTIAIGFYFLIEDSFSRRKQASHYDYGHDESDNQELNEELFEDDEDY